ncbi:hypothetical protein [Tessaracoccus antarcticus]|uniref:Uncharacterized protein n=1 Tax=Tessaracoccus antarcticus TaxID=2479848 RepID=A0A3M0G9W5_9ACTN|nr:hypothetical protein [Tessaracoccus antarcticus]RMB61730.1 hypothetical protein EAX62_03650 [Tessaracoccus antarcticus]
MTVEFNPSSWQRTGHGYEDVAPDVDSTLGSLISGTTNPAACGAANGMATVDGAITILLGTLADVMAGVQSDVAAGLLAEALAMINTGQDYAALEDDSVAAANSITTGW